VLEDWLPPFPGFFMYYPSRQHQPAALSALVCALRLPQDQIRTLFCDCLLHPLRNIGTADV
jgi:hypothetical protein